MKTGKIEILGKEQTLCFSTRVTSRCIEKYGSIDAMFDALGGDDLGKALEQSLWLLSEMLDAGRRYARRAWEREEEAVSYDDLLDLYGLDDVGTLGQALKETVISGSKREVVTEAKNAEATQGGNGEKTALRG